MDTWIKQSRRKFVRKGDEKLTVYKKHSISKPSAQKAQEGFLMYTQAQIKVLKKYKKALQDYNEGKIDFKEYVNIALPLWNEINILFDTNQKIN